MAALAPCARSRTGFSGAVCRVYNDIMSRHDAAIRADCLPYPKRSERETVVADARHVVHLDPATRAAAFISLHETLEAVLAQLSPGERRRRRRAAELLDPRPHPWWSRLRRTEWPTDDVAS